jgi:phenylacetic acid degradation operon negative regulatory protein
MKDGSPDWFENCVTELTASGTQRVWSVLVTIFGDLAPNESDQISGALISKLTGMAGIKAEATRVALHRLRKEGWIESTRLGRNSVHSLADFGRSQSAAAVPRIYAMESIDPKNWHLLLADSSNSSRQELADLLLTGEYVSLNSQTAIAAGPAPSGVEDLLVLHVDDIAVPDWLRQKCGPVELRNSYDHLLETFRNALALLPKEGAADPFQSTVLRVLVVHNWRRAILRHPELPKAFFPKDWNEPSCRKIFHQLLDSLPRPSLADLESELGS